MKTTRLNTILCVATLLVAGTHTQRTASAADQKSTNKISTKTSTKTSKSMTNSIPAGYDYQVISNTNHPGLTFRFLKPNDFKIVDLPAETPDLSKGTAFLPLAVAMTPIGPLVLSVAARPAYEDGTVEQWLDYLLRE